VVCDRQWAGICGALVNAQVVILVEHGKTIESGVVSGNTASYNLVQVIVKDRGEILSNNWGCWFNLQNTTCCTARRYVVVQRTQLTVTARFLAWSVEVPQFTKEPRVPWKDSALPMFNTAPACIQSYVLLMSTIWRLC
jgi:hypothetical protein